MNLFSRIFLILLVEVFFVLPLTSCNKGGGSDPFVPPNDDGGGGAGTPTTILITGAPTGTLNGGDLSGDITIPYTLTNTGSVLTNLIAEFSVNGVVFDPMTLGVGGDGTFGLTSSPTGTAHTFVWDSASNLPSSFGPRTNVLVRLTATAIGTTTSSLDTSSAFDINNNLGVPSAVVSDPSASSGTILISYTLTDVDGDLISIIPEFSINDGVTFFPATQGSGGDGISALAPGAHTFAWQSASDIPGTSTLVRFQIRPFDAEVGIAGINPTTFTVDNSSLPLATITTVGGLTFTGDATISVTFTDLSTSSPTTADVEFSTNGGLSFSPCTPDVTSDFTSSTDLFPLPTSLDFVWDTATDIPSTSGIVTGVIFRITPVEGTTDGIPDSITVTVDNTGGGGGAGFAFRAGTDKWQINTAEDDDSDSTADFVEGLTNADSGTNPSFESDVPLATDTLLSQLNVYYRNNADGSAAAGGLDISFQTAAGAGGTAPAPGTLQGSGFDSLDFSSIAIRNILHIPSESGSTNPVGVAFFTSGGNTSIENNSQTGFFPDPTELGVFVDRHNGFWNATGFAPTQRTITEYMKFLGQVTAHEIGHSIDFAHTSAAPPAPATTNIMAASSTIGPGVEFAFDNTLFSSAQGYMPGPNRCCNPMGMTPIQLLRASSSVVIGKRLNSQDPVSFQVLELLYGESLDSVIGIDGLSPHHPIYQLPEETLFIACLKPKGQDFQVVPGEGALFAISQTSEWIDSFQSYATLLNQQSSPDFHQALLSQLQADLFSTNEQIRLNAMYELMMARLVPFLNSEDLQRIMTLLSTETQSLQERQAAVQILTIAGKSEFGGELQTLGLRAPKSLLQGIAGALETSLGTEAVTQSLLSTLENLSESELHNAVVLLGWQRSRSAVEPLVSLMKQEPSESVQIALADALGCIADPSALSPLQIAVRSTGSVSLKKHLYRAIGQIGTESAKMWLRQESYRNPDPSLQSTIQQSEKFAKTMEIR